MNLEVSNILTIYYLQLLYREVRGILLYQGFPRPILPTKHPESGKGCFADEIGPKKVVVQNFIVFLQFLNHCKPRCALTQKSSSFIFKFHLLTYAIETSTLHV